MAAIEVQDGRFNLALVSHSFEDALSDCFSPGNQHQRQPAPIAQFDAQILASWKILL